MKQQQQKGSLTQTTTTNIPANISVQNQKLGIATQINVSKKFFFFLFY